MTGHRHGAVSGCGAWPALPTDDSINDGGVSYDNVFYAALLYHDVVIYTISRYVLYAHDAVMLNTSIPVRLHTSLPMWYVSTSLGPELSPGAVLRGRNKGAAQRWRARYARYVLNTLYCTVHDAVLRQWRIIAAQLSDL